jgi:hypothetical protein
VVVVNESQRADHAYQERRLLDLIAERDKQSPGSKELLSLNRQISDVEDVVRSYRLVRRAAGDEVREDVG